MVEYESRYVYKLSVKQRVRDVIVVIFGHALRQPRMAPDLMGK
jgi:hypothetical protein